MELGCVINHLYRLQDGGSTPTENYSEVAALNWQQSVFIWTCGLIVSQASPIIRAPRYFLLKETRLN